MGLLLDGEYLDTEAQRSISDHFNHDDDNMEEVVDDDVDEDGDNEYVGKAERPLIKARVSGETEHQPCHSVCHTIPLILTTLFCLQQSR